jgi:hypothetical protein
MVTGVQEEIKQLRFNLPKPNPGVQTEIFRCATNINAKCGRRFGKTFVISDIDCAAFLGICRQCMGMGCASCFGTGRVRQKRVLYAAPTAEQMDKFWFEVKTILEPGIEAGIFVKNETEHTIEIPGTEIRIKAKTAWNADTLRGDWGDLITPDEWQLFNEDCLDSVIRPMLLDTNGQLILAFTPPSRRTIGVSKANDPMHATKFYNHCDADKSGRWTCFHATSHDNPKISHSALATIQQDMSADVYRREIMAEDEEIQLNWLVFSKFDIGTQKIKRFKIPESWSVYTGHDFGTANPAAVFVAQVRPPLPPDAPAYLRIGDYVAFNEYAPGSGTSAAQHIDKFKEIMGITPDNKSRLPVLSVGGNLTTEQQTRELYTRLGWRINPPTIKYVNAQVDRFIALIEQRQFYVMDDLHGILDELANCMWELDANKVPQNKIRNEAHYHRIACLRTLATVLSINQNSAIKKVTHIHKY